jgi:hypothetical protein
MQNNAAAGLAAEQRGHAQPVDAFSPQNMQYAAPEGMAWPHAAQRRSGEGAALSDASAAVPASSTTISSGFSAKTYGVSHFGHCFRIFA